ncbi:2-alkyl-3-oxoalkanoate reductase [Ralstonia wenshanensis]|uniref:NAD-dependent epimerase/dehydratase family protein n=1 Tax=Ralstonia wenshanensis TaxID=2842456 RepID=UPI0028F59E10|nr:NAD(P)-dependent oxidoreductase [Ralstonia wenshanensis]CAJ0813307.1 2-alkyl-3-oxoalkanoate reductase [Ralstonia wenshanensis]
MTTLVTGATGGLGRNAVDALLAQGARVRATGRDAAQREAFAARGAEYVPADLAQLTPATLDALLDGVDTVWHCAALSSPWGAYEDFYAANVRATAALAEGAVKRGVRRFVHISTPSIYFDYQHHADLPESYRPARFPNHYAATKMLAEAAIQQQATTQHRTHFVILRPRGLFGPHDRVVLPRILHLLELRGGVLPLPRGGAARMDLTYLENVVHAMQCATTADVPSGAAYNITNHAPATLRDLLDQLLGQQLGLRYRIRAVPYPAMALAARVMEAGSALTRREPLLTRYSAAALHYDMTLANDRARIELGYVPPIDMAEGIRRTAHWLREHGNVVRF